MFRRRRRPRSALARLLSGVTETCQSWLDQKVFGGMFGMRQNQDPDLDQTQSDQAGPSLLDESLWSDLSGTELDDGCSFTYGECPVRTRFSWFLLGPLWSGLNHQLPVADPNEIPPPPDKEAPAPKMLIQEEICSEICQSKEGFTQSMGGLSEVPPPSPFYTNSCCCQTSPEPTGELQKPCA